MQFGQKRQDLSGTPGIAGFHALHWERPAQGPANTQTNAVNETSIEQPGSSKSRRYKAVRAIAFGIGIGTSVALKGHGFSRAAKSIKQQWALAPEGSILLPSKTIPQGLKCLRENSTRHLIFTVEMSDKRSMSRFKPYRPDQAYLLPPSVRDELGANHLCFFVLGVVERLDMTVFEQSYSVEGGELYGGWPTSKSAVSQRWGAPGPDFRTWEREALLSRQHPIPRSQNRDLGKQT